MLLVIVFVIMNQVFFFFFWSQEHDQKRKQPEIQPSDVFHGSTEDTKISVVAPPRKKKLSVEKCQVQEKVPLKEESTSVKDALLEPPETPSGTEVTGGTAVLELTSAELSSDEFQGANSREEKTDEEMKLVPEESAAIHAVALPVDGAETSPQNLRRHSGSDEIQAILEATVVADELKLVSQHESASLELKEVLPPKRKSKSLPLQDAEQKVAQLDEKTGSQRFALDLRKETEGSAIAEAKLIPARRKSKSGIAQSSELTVSHHASADREHDCSKPSALLAEPETTDTIPAEDKPSPSKRRSKESKHLSEPADAELTESTQDSVEQVHLKTKETCQAEEEIHKKQNKKPDSSDAKTASENIEEPDWVEPLQKTENIILKESKVTPPKRKSKGAVSLSGEISLELKETRTDLDSASVPDQSVTITSRDDGTLKSVAVTSQDLSGETETQTIKKPDTLMKEASDEGTPNTDPQPTSFQEVSEDVKKGKISPPRRKVKAQQLSIQIETTGLSQTNEDSHLVHSTEQKEAVPVEINEPISERGFRNSLETTETEKESPSHVLDLSAAVKPNEQPSAVTEAESSNGFTKPLYKETFSVQECDTGRLPSPTELPCLVAEDSKSKNTERKSNDVDFSTVSESGLQDFTDGKTECSLEEVDKPTTTLVTKKTDCIDDDSMVVDMNTGKEDTREQALGDQDLLQLQLEKGDGPPQSEFRNLESVSKTAQSAPAETTLNECLTAQDDLNIALVVDKQEQLAISAANVQKQKSDDHETFIIGEKQVLEQHPASTGKPGDIELNRAEVDTKEHSQRESFDIISAEQNRDDPRQLVDMETNHSPATSDVISTSMTCDVQEEPKTADEPRADATHIAAGQHKGDVLSPCTEHTADMGERLSLHTDKESVCDSPAALDVPFLKNPADVETESQSGAEQVPTDTSSESVQQLEHAGKADFEYTWAAGTQSKLQHPQDVEIQEKNVCAIVLDTSQAFLQTSGTRPCEKDFTETCNELDFRLESVTSDTLSSEFPEPEHKSDDALEQSGSKFMDRDLLSESHMEAAPRSDDKDTSEINKYIDNLYESIWKNQTEVQKRYLVLNVPDNMIFQTCEADFAHKSQETVAQSDTSTTLPHAAAWTQEGPTLMTKTSPSEDDMSGQSETGNRVKFSDQKTCLERPENVLDCLVEKEQSEELTYYLPGEPESQEKVCEVRILQLDMSTNPGEEEDTMSFRLGREQRIDITKTIIQDESEQETRPEVQDTLSPTDLAKLHPSSQTSPEPKTEFIEIQLFEKTVVEPRETETQTEKIEAVKEESSQDEDPSSIIHGRESSLTCLDEGSIFSKRVPIEAEECVLYIDIQTAPEDQEHNSAPRETEKKINIVQTDIQTQRIKQTSTDSVAEHKMSEMKTEEQQSGCKDCGDPMQIYSHETKISSRSPDVINHTQTETEFTKTTQEGPGQDIEDVREDRLEDPAQRLEVEEKLVTIQKQPGMLDLQKDISSNLQVHQPNLQKAGVVDAADVLRDRSESAMTHEEDQESISGFLSKDDPVTTGTSREQLQLTEEHKQRQSNVTMETSPEMSPTEVLEKEFQNVSFHSLSVSVYN